MNKKIRSRSIGFRLALAFIVSVAIQSILLASIMVGGGVLQEARENQYRIFSEKVSSRKNILENEMGNVWTNFGRDKEGIERYFQELDEEQEKSEDHILEELAPTVLNALFRTKATGAFLVLPEHGEMEGALPALYFRNSNPSRNSRSRSSLYMLVGPWNVAEKMGISTVNNWSLRLNLNEENGNFVYKPYQAAKKIGDSELLGYWSPPFQINKDNEEVITYSTPIFGENGEVKAVFGVEISMDYLYDLLPQTELDVADSYGYMIGIRAADGELMPSITHGGVQRRMIKKSEPLQMKEVDDENLIFEILNHNSNTDIYACMEQMVMYYPNTPFEGEEWFLIGMIEKPSLLQFPHKIGTILTWSFIASIIIGAVIAVLISEWFTRHAKLIELTELPVGAIEMRNHSGRVLMTSQIPHLLNLTPEQEKNFCTNKKKFDEFLSHLKESEEGEGIYKLTSLNGIRWVRITRKDAEGVVRCIVEDVTDEVINTKALKVERDLDGLTGVKNRLAFEKAMKDLKEHHNEENDIFLVMCDLNNLKGVNDYIGHDKGDEYIRTAAQAVKEAFKKEGVFRIGGDEFAVIVKAGNESEVQEAIAGIKRRMEEYGKGTSFKAAIAAGYAHYDPSSETGLDGALARADAAMYKDKRAMKRIRQKDAAQ